VTAPLRVRLVIALKPPGKNDLRPDMMIMKCGSRLMPTAFLRLKGLEDKWRRRLPEPRPDQRALGKRTLRFTRLMTAREHRMDRWNLEGGLNLVVVDMLVKLGWLIDDAEHAVEMLPAIQRRALPDEPAPGTLIEIEDLPGTALETPALPGLNLQT
jgi:hypothetical protein